MHPDEQIAIIDRCEQARREAVAASGAEREEAIVRWVGATHSASGLCTNTLHEALITKDARNHEVALEVLARVGWREHKSSFLGDLDNERLTPEQLDRVFASLTAVSGQNFGSDRAAWTRWLRSEP